MIKNLVIPGPEGEANLEIPSALDVNDPFESQATRETIIHLELEPKTVRALKNVLYFIEREAALTDDSTADQLAAGDLSERGLYAAARMHLRADETWGRLCYALLAAGERTSWNHNDYDS